MKIYYTVTFISYNDYSDEEVWEGQESYEAFITAKDEISAIKKITDRALKTFKKDFSEKIVITGFNIDTFYETTEGATL